MLINIGQTELSFARDNICLSLAIFGQTGAGDVLPHISALSHAVSNPQGSIQTLHGKIYEVDISLISPTTHIQLSSLKAKFILKDLPSKLSLYSVFCFLFSFYI